MLCSLRLYVCDADSHCVCIFDVNGKFLFSFGSYGSCDECFDHSTSLMLTIVEFVYMIKMVNSLECSALLRVVVYSYIDATDCGHLIVNSFVFNTVI